MPKINLSQFGLSNEESKIYLALVKLGMASAIKIGQVTGQKRTTIYYHLDNLIAKSLVIESFTKNRRVYQPASVNTLNTIFDRREKEFSEQKAGLRGIIERVQGMAKQTSASPEVRILKGKDGLVETMNDVLTTKENIYFIGSHDVVLEDEKLLSTEYFLRNFTAKRRQKGGTVAYIISDFSKLTLRQQKEEDTDFRHILIWSELNGVNGGVIAYGTKVVVYSVDLSVTIYCLNNPLVADIIKLMFRQIFKLSAKRHRRFSAGK